MKPGLLFRCGPRMAKSRGFTILELVVVVAIVGILSAMAMPSLRDMLRSQRVKTAVADVHASLVYARSEAIKRGQFVAICASTDGATCVGAANWATGWIVFADPNGDGVPAAGDILKKQSAETGITLTGTTTNVSYRRDGRLVAALTTDFAASSPGLAVSRCVRVSPSGQPDTYGC